MGKDKPAHVLVHRIHSHDPRLKRFVVHDPRSRDFVAKMARQLVTTMHKLAGHLPLDQGQVGSCTANAATAALLTEPYFDKLGRVEHDEEFALGLYHDETELHPHDGVYPPEDPGGCGLWIAKVLKNRGLIKGYRHAFGLMQSLRSLVVGPVIYGIDRYSSFNTPGVNGLVSIKPGARVEGGHEICAYGVDVEKKLVWFVNSWGNSWGIGGKFCMSFDTLDQLLKNQGDCTQFTV